MIYASKYLGESPLAPVGVLVDPDDIQLLRTPVSHLNTRKYTQRRHSSIPSTSLAHIGYQQPTMAQPQPKTTDNIDILPITVPPPNPHLPTLTTKYKNLRLTALKTAPTSFSSTYAHESQFSDETWTSRVLNPRGQTFIAVRRPSEHASTGLDAHDEMQRLLHYEWVGQLTLIGPDVLSEEEKGEPWMVFLGGRDQSSTSDEGEAGVEGGKHAAYILVGMFVLSAFQGLGIGRRLIEAAMERVERDRAEREDVARFTVIIMVEQHNGTARRLYEKCGFDVRDEAAKVKIQDKWVHVVAMTRDITRM